MDKKHGHQFHLDDNYLEELSIAYRNIPSPTRLTSEVTSEVVSRMLERSSHSRRHMSSNILRRNIFTRVAVMLCVFVLVGGTCYAAYSEYVLPLRNKSGVTVFQVAKTDIPSTPADEDRILNNVIDVLKDGEQAVVYIGQSAIQEQNGEVLPQKGSHYSIVVKPIEFDSAEHMNDYLLERGLKINLPLSDWREWSLSRSELYNDILHTDSKERKKWNIATDEQTGKEYKYTIGPSTSVPHALSWYYSKLDEEMMLTVSLNIPIMPTFYDSNPSSDSILKINGVEAYLYRDPKGSNRSINWSEKIADGNYRSYSVITHTADDDELRKFAAAVISNQQ